eukprot:CAMPEP_0184203902 /NCGR_PEP_ID=MMETSP0976-20121227/9295_1 /TAXON_ID=483370 /ORGANISM="non described non described, Strain CCMP2097" /LENGTH=76 /DNA_ID=CAMNT_0026508473 /DNA_START=114 /DNA_END=340 /DNA_ORIENTATION=-
MAMSHVKMHRDLSDAPPRRVDGRCAQLPRTGGGPRRRADGPSARPAAIDDFSAHGVRAFRHSAASQSRAVPSSLAV